MVFEAIEAIDEDIVISGIGLRTADSVNTEDLTEILYNGENPVHHDDRPVPGGYYGEYPEYQGRTKDPWKFDFTYFGVSKVVAKHMDPMIRKIFECTFEALLDAGLNPIDLKSTNSYFYSGVTFSDYDLEWDNHFRGGYGIMGRNRCMNANRISYWLNCYGSSVATDCNWSNGLVNLGLAYNNIKNGHCDTAVINGASIACHNEFMLQMRDLGVLNNDGKTKCFDDAADGYSRSDGVVVLVLQRASIAKRSYASIKHVMASCKYNPHSTYSLSSQKQWEEFLSNFYEQAKIDINDVYYYEANASGIREEDARELNAVSNVLCKNRTSPLLIGSVKSNFGHTEAASGLMGIVKALLTFEREQIAQNLHYTSPNKLIPGLIDGRLKVVETNVPMPEDKLIAVSAYGFGGVYSHLLLKGNPFKRIKPYDRIPRLILMSAPIKETIEAIFDNIESMPYNEDYYALLHSIFTKKVEKYMARGYMILPKRENQILRESEIYAEDKRPVWFIFSGMGSQWNGMGKALLELPLFRESIERSHAILAKKGLDLLNIITTDDPKIFDNILHAFVGIAATQIALVDILRVLEIVPDGIIGHSVGELGCAYADGALTAEQMILCAYYRGMASIETTDLIKGFMAAVGKGYNQIKDELPPEVDVACHNSTDSCTLSGPAEIVRNYVEKLKADKVFAKTVNVANIAYHSRYIRPVAPRLLNYLKQVIPNPLPRSSKWVSTSNSREEWNDELAKYCSAEYHTKNLTNAVLFEEGCVEIPENSICIEIAPHGLLQAILKRSLPSEVIHIPLTRRPAENQLIFFLQAIGKMSLAGLQPKVEKLYPAADFPVPRGTPSVAQIVRWDVGDQFLSNFKVNKRTKHSIRNQLMKTNVDSIGYVIDGKSIYPPSVFITMAWNICSKYGKKVPEDNPITLHTFRLDAPLYYTTTDDTDLTIMINSGTSYLEFSSEDKTIIVHGHVSDELEAISEFDNPKEAVKHTLYKNDVYAELENRGYDITAPFQVLDKVEISENSWKGFSKWDLDWTQKVETLIQLATLQKGEQSRALLYPVSFQTVVIDPHEHLSARDENSEFFEINYIIDQNAITCPGIQITGMKFRELSRPKVTLSFLAQKFRPYKTTSVDNFVDHCLEIVRANQNSRNEKKSIKVHRIVGLDSSGLGADIENRLNVEVRVDKFTKGFNVGDDPVDLVIADFISINDTLALSKNTKFIIVKSNSNNNVTPNGFEIVSQITSKNGELVYLLSRSIDMNDIEFITISNDELVLINILNHRSSNKKTFCLVGSTEQLQEAGGLENYIKSVEKATSVDLRWLFVFDKTAPVFNATLPFYYGQILKNLRVNVYLNNNWGIYNMKSLVENTSGPNLNVYSRRLDPRSEVKFNFVALNMEPTRQTSEIITDFSGELVTGTPIMGMAVINSTVPMKHDPHLMWQVPKTWTPEEACSVPLPYLFAYYCIKLAGLVLSYENVLVTDGLTTNSRAAIAVALTCAREVYATVANNEEKSQLLKLFPKLKPNYVFIHSKNYHLALINEVGRKEMPQVLFNSLEGECLLATLNTMNAIGRIFHFGRQDIDKNLQMGTSVFLNYNLFIQMSSKRIINLSVEEKDKLQVMMSEGIQQGVVRPLPFIKLTSDKIDEFNNWQNSERKLSRVIIDSNIISRDSKKLVIDSLSSYIIFSDSSDVWLDVAESLTQQGAKNIVIVRGSQEGQLLQSERSRRRMEFLQGRDQLNISIRQQNERNTYELLEEADHLAPIAAVFLIALSKSNDASTIEKIAEFDRLWRRRNGHFIVLSAGQPELGKICEARLSAGFQAINVLWTADEKLIGAHVDSITQLSGQEPVIKVTNSGHSENVIRNAGKILLDLLPKELNELDEIGEQLSKETELIELATLSRRNTEAKGLSPIIFIPGLQSDPVRMVQPLACRIRNPVFCAKIPHIGEQSVECIAAGILAEKNGPDFPLNLDGFKCSQSTISLLPNKTLDVMCLDDYVTLTLQGCPIYKKFNPEGLKKIRQLTRKPRNVNVIGISWGCVVAMELTKQLEKLEHKVSLITIDNPLHAVQQGAIPQKTVDAILLSLIASNSSQANNFAEMSWDSGLDSALGVLELDSSVERNIREAATFVKNHLHSMLKYSPNDLRFLGPFAVLRSKEVHEEIYYTKLCHNVVVRDYDMSREEFLESVTLTDLINQAILCEDMNAKNAHWTSWVQLEKFIELDRSYVDGGLLLNFDYLKPKAVSNEERLAIPL